MGKKRAPQKATIAAAVEDAASIVRDLHDEIDEVVTGMENRPGLAATARFQTLSDTRDILSEQADALESWDGDEVPAEPLVEWVANQEKKVTRRMRLGNAEEALAAAIAALEQLAEDHKDSDDTPDYATLASELEDAKEALEECEFSSMYG